VTCGYALGTSRRLAADDDTMCPECARSGLSMPRGRERQLRRSFQAEGQAAASLVEAGLLIAWLRLSVSGFRSVLARGWHDQLGGSVIVRMACRDLLIPIRWLRASDEPWLTVVPAGCRGIWPVCGPQLIPAAGLTLCLTGIPGF